MSNGFYLADSRFEAIVKGGGFLSLKCAADELDTQFVLPGESFSGFFLDVCTGEESFRWAPGEDGSYIDKEPCRLKQGIHQYGYAESRGLKVESSIFLSGGRLTQRITVTNTGREGITLGNAGFALPCNTEFKWGEAASSKVIGHTFISENGSHNVYTRCDGKGPYLVMMPVDNTKLVYYDLGAEEQSKLNPEKLKKVLYIYTVSRLAREKAKEKGSRRGGNDRALTLAPGEKAEFGFVYAWAEHYREVRDLFVENGLLDVEVFPGMTVEKQGRVLVSIRCKFEKLSLCADKPAHTQITEQTLNGDAFLYEMIFEKTGENSIRIEYGEDKVMRLEFFVTEPVETMIRKRGAFIAGKQFKSKELWYDGLFAEWNNETAVLLSPDNYDRIKGWRIYEVTCDDPGLSKPAFLSGKIAEYPVQEEVDALDYYIENFVWGGLQCTTQEEFPYGLYGIPDWHKNRNSDNPGLKGRLHLWRIYDYPHIFMMYFNMYRVAKCFKGIRTALDRMEYLERAYRTALAMFLIPSELAEWSAYKTGLYNEWVIRPIIDSLNEEGEKEKAQRLSIHWRRKITYFINECKDVFGSEYPFDTTGFESTHVFAREAMDFALMEAGEDKKEKAVTYCDAIRFMENQTSCNIACRGYLEPAYYWYGSDYRSNNYTYTLSYMSQMGGSSLLDYALYYAQDPFSLLRLAYGSLLSSWALLNCGDEESGYGYWFPGKEHDGAACGGFEPLPYGTTWLDQPHRCGPWYYSCEIDLGFCGALHGAATIFAMDPLFGALVYGGELTDSADFWFIKSSDGVGKRFHYVSEGKRLHMTLDKGRLDGQCAVTVRKDLSEIRLLVNREALRESLSILLLVENAMGSSYEIEWGGSVRDVLVDNGKVQYVLPPEAAGIVLRLKR